MRELPHCPDPLPTEIDVGIHRLARLWAAHPMRPRLIPRIAARWDALISAWAADERLPLLVRKSESDVARGEVIIHDSGRELVPTDNSPASWSYMKAYAGEVPTLREVHGAFASDSIPVAMVVDREMRARSRYRCCRVKMLNPNAFGWKVCHKLEVGLNGRASLKNRPIVLLQAHFRDFLSPSNMFLVPLFLGGLGEVRHFIEAISRQPRGL